MIERKTETSVSQTDLLRRRTANRVIIVVMLAFTLIGIIAALRASTFSREQLTSTQASALAELSEQLNDWWQTALNDTRFLATNSVTREFASSTIQTSTNSAGAQTQFLQILTTLIERQRGVYLAARYITANGFIWSEVTNYNATQPTVITEVHAGGLSDSDTFQRGLNTPINEVTYSPVQFRTSDTASVPFIRFVSPVDPTGEMMSISGQVQIEVSAKPLLDLITSYMNNFESANPNRTVLLLDHQGNLLLDSAASGGTGTSLAARYAQLAQLIDANPGGTRAASVGGLVVSSVPLAISSPTGERWQLILFDNVNLAVDSATTNAVLTLLLVLVVGGAVSVMLNNILKGSFRPLEATSAFARQIAGESDAPTQAEYPSANGMDDVLRAFEHLQAQVQNVNQTLDARTQRYQRNLEIATRISRETATLRDLDTLLNRTLDLIVTEYGFYHAQLFLIDDVKLNAVLRYSHGEAGKQLLAQGHKLPVGSSSVIGQVTARALPVIVNDTSAPQDEPHRFNPILAKTRAEMALPLLAGGNTIGALDIQSELPDVFREDELQIFQLLADQLAIAIQNSRLIAESEMRVQQIDHFNRQFTRGAWQETIERGDVEEAYHYDLVQIEPGETTVADAFSVPIAVRGVVVGELAATSNDDLGLTQGDEIFLRAIADRVALAIENARLLNETQNSLAETFVLYQLSRALGETQSLEDVISAIVTTVMPIAVGGQIALFDDRNDAGEQLTVAAAWHRSQEVTLDNTSWRVADHPILAGMTAERVTIVQDIEQDRRIDAAFRGALQTALGAQAAIFIPFSVRGVWRGILIVGFPQPREFSEQDGRLYSAVIDQAGVTIENRLLLTQNEIALAQIERLYDGSRIVNMAQSAQDVVRAALAANADASMRFELALLEGALDESGYPSLMHVVARTEGIEVLTVDESYPLSISPDSPLRSREALTLRSKQPGAASFATYMQQHQYQFGVAFPLYSANQPIALFLVVSEDQTHLLPEDYEIYRALAGQMSTVLQNRRLLEQTAQALDETRRLYDASRAIAAADSAEAIYAVAAEHLARAIPQVTRVSVLLTTGDVSFDAPYVVYDYVWARSSAYVSGVKPGLRLSADLVSFGRLFNAYGTVLRYNDIKEDLPALQLGPLQAILERSRSSSALIVALQIRQKWLGVLLIESDQTDVFSAQFMPFTQAIADQLAIAIDSVQLFAEAQHEAQRALALAEAGQLANRIGSDLALSFRDVFSRVAQAANYRFWQLLVLDESGDWLDEVTSYLPRASTTHVTHFNVATDQHSLLDAFRTGSVVSVNDPVSALVFANVAEESRAEYGKHVAAPITLMGERLGAIFLGRYLADEDISERDEQLALTLASQVAVALENRRLLRSAEIEKETLRSILNTLPVGIMVLDIQTLRPIQSNEQAEVLLGRKIDGDTVFSIEAFNLYRTGTDVLYPESDLPIYVALRSLGQEVSDDVSVVRPDGSEVDLLLNAAPLLSANGRATAIVTAFQDITTLRSLENTLQDTLRETITLYETTRALAEAPGIDDVLDLIINQLALSEPNEVYVLLHELDSDDLRVARTMSGEVARFPLPESVLDPIQPRFIGDTTDPHLLTDDAERIACSREGIQALITLPLRVRFREDAPLGWVVLTYVEAQSSLYEQEQSITTLIESAAVTLDNRYLIRSTDRALAETASLYRATTAVSRAQSLEELGEALQSALEWLSPDMYAAYLNPGDDFTPIFNVSLDSDAVNFGAALQHYEVRYSGQTFINDLRAVENPGEFEEALLRLGNVRAIGVMPLRFQGLTGGVLVVAYHYARRFGDVEVRYLNSIADSASVVADNITLLEQIQSNLTETSMLYLASRDLNDATTERDILNVVIEHLLGRPVNNVMTLLFSGNDWNDPDATLRVTANWKPEGSLSPDMQDVVLRPNQFAAWDIFSQSDVILIDDVETDGRVEEEARISLLSMEMRSLSVMPLRVAARSLGAIVIGSGSPYQHSDRDERIYRSFAHQASLRLEASQLFAQTQRRARQLATSARVSQLASSLEELNRLLPTVVDLIKEAFGYDHVQIFMMDEEDRFAVLSASTGESGQQLLGIGHKLEKGSRSVIGRVTESGEPVLALDIADTSVVHRPNPYLPNTRSEIAVPLVLKGLVVGALDVQSNQPHFFTEEDVSVLTTLAAQISVAIDNSKLYEQSQERADAMFFLFTVASAASGADSLGDAMTNVVVSLEELLEATAVTIYLPVELSDGEQSIVELRPAALAGTEMPLSEISEVRLGETDNLLARVAVERQPQVIRDLSKEPGYLPIVGDARSAILVPLVVGTKLVSLITMESTEVNAFDDDTLTLLLTLSSTLAATVQNQQLLEELQRTNEQLLELDRLKSDFLANMSHELRTPLNSIIGFSRVILKGIDGPLTEMQEQDLTTIYNSGQHLLNLINDILDQAKIAAGKMDLQSDYFDMKPVIDGVRSIGIGLVKDKPIEIIVHVAPGLPKVFGDEFRTRQVLLNLVSNASKFTREGTITINAYAVDDDETEAQQVCVEVTDTGMGISEKDLPLLFEAFRQVDSSLTKTHGGTGLGLPIAKSLIEMQGGHMTVQSRVNVGSTFAIYMPIQEPAVKKLSTQETKSVKVAEETGKPVSDSKATGTNGSEPPTNGNGNGDHHNEEDAAIQPILATSTHPAHKKRQILLIEDSPDMVDQFRRTLQRDGFDVFTASIPLEAEAMASGLRPTLIVLDANFANDSGWAILERLVQREDTIDIPIIVVALSDEAERVQQLGAFRFIRKPFMPEVLSQAVKDAEKETLVERILIIDDEPDSAQLIQDLLDETGKYRVLHAADGVEGMSLVARRRPDLVILNLRMAGMNGFQVIQELRANPETATIPIMVMSGDTLGQDEMMQLSQLKVIYKPDIDTSGYKTFLDSVKNHFTRENGEN